MLRLRIDYADAEGRRTRRTIQPFAVACHVEATLVCAWCELRDDIRTLRSDRIVTAEVLDEPVTLAPGLIADWLALREDQ